jgi:uncharacterized protein with NRDE domain
MCTLAVAFQTDRRWPIVVAANRDERLARAAEGWAAREPQSGPRYAAPRDLLAGGTWIGVSASGLFAALTNYHAPSGAFPDPQRRSRGEIVARALAHPSAAAARAGLAAEPAAAYNPFHLIVADPAGAFLWRYDGERAEIDVLEPGLWIVTESDAFGRTARGERVRARWPLDADLGALRRLLAEHAPSPRDATCIHLDPLYGTRSSAILRLAPTLSASELYVAEGRPCTAPFEDRSRLLHDLSRFA